MGKFVKVGKKEETREQENNTESKSVGRFVRVGNKSTSDTQPKTISGGSPMADGSPITTGRTVPANSFLAHRLSELERQKTTAAPSETAKHTPITTNDLIADTGNKVKRISEEDISSLMARQSELVRQGREMTDEYDDVSAQLLAAQRQNREADRIDHEAKEAERAAQLEDGYRRASLYDLTVNAARRGFYGALEGQDSYYDMVGQPNQKERWDKVLASDDFKYTPQNFAEEALEGAAQLLGQQAYTIFGPRAIASGLALAGTAALAGQAGPQVALPEEVITVPGAFATGLGVSSAMSNFEIEAGNAYNEMLEHGVSQRTASLVAQGVGGVNALLEAAQFDELVKAYQSIAGDHVTNPIKRTIWEAVQNYGYDLLNESLQESAQEGVTIAGTQLGSLIDTGDVAYSPEEIMDRELETFGSSVLSFGLMGAPALAGNVYNSRASRPVITREAATEGLIRAGADQETAENLAPIVASIVNGEEISGNEAGKIARSEAAIELVEAATGATINTDAPISEVKNAIKELARPQESVIEAEPISNTPAEETAQESEMNALEAVEQPENGGTVEERTAIAEATSREDDVKDTDVLNKSEAPAAEMPKRTTKSEERQKAREFVERFSDSFGKTGKSVFTDMYTDGQDAAQYAEDMMKAYNIGKKGLVTDSEWNNTVIVRTFRSGGATIPQLKAAYTAGKSDAESAKLISGEKNGLPFDVVVEKMPTGNTALANNANEGYTENSKNGLGRLVARLAKTDKAEVDGLFYTIKQKNDGFYTEMRRDDPDGYITNARASLWSGGPFATREEAVDDLLSVARASVYKEKAAAERPESRPAPDLKQPDAWDSVVNDERVSTMSEGEKEAVKEIFTAKGETKNPQAEISDNVLKLVESGKPLSSADLFRIADSAYGGTMAEGKYTVKDAYDGMELAVNRYLMNARFVTESANGDIEAAKRTLKKLQSILSLLPTQTKRTEEMDSYQQFSTPPTIAYLAAWTANFDKSDVVLEPSAGIGGLALWPKAWGATVYGNELSERRLAFLNKLGLDGTFNLNAEQINNLLPDEIKPTAVIMNPPFSSTAGRLANNNTANAKRHIEQALERLEDGGRLVAILGKGMSDDASAFRSWWSDLRKEYSIRANIRIDGENYKKYGTTWDIQLAVIDNTGAQTGKTVTGNFTNLEDALDVLEGIRNDRERLDTGSETAVRDVRHETVEPGTDTGAHADGGERPQRGSGTDGVNDGRGVQNGASQRSGDRGSSGKRSGGGGNKSAVQTVRKGSEQNGVQRNENVTESRGADGGSSQRIELDRSDLTPEKAKVKDSGDSVYSEYVPRKARIKGAMKHPAKLVESAAMAAVEPPDVTYRPNLPDSIVKKGILSDAQLENVIYAGQAHEQKLPDGQRKGFFIGDGTGVGKGRQIAGIIMDNFRQNRKKAVWISEKSALINDAVRDWKALGGKEDDVIDLKKIKYKSGAKITANSGILFSSYDTLKTDKDARLKLLKDWLGEDFDGVIALDEAHNMGNANGKKGTRGSTKPSAKALAGIDIQKAFPNARIVYASATGATDASNYAYLTRLGLWGKGTAFNDFNDFMSKISNGGLAAMELVARDMKAMGLYMARSISYDDVKYDTLTHDLTPVQTEIYNTMSKAWQKVLQNVNRALEITGQKSDGMARGRAMSAIFGTQQRFYNQILTSMSMPSVIEDMKKELAAGRSCVLQLVNTNAAAADRAIAKNAEEGGDLDDLDLTPSDMLIEMLKKSFPIELYEEYTDDEGRLRSRPVLDGNGNQVIDKKALKMRDDLIADLKMMKVPDGPLEMLFDAFGEENVAEVTGRTRRVVEKLDENGSRKRVIERRSNNSGIADANMFQEGKKRILVFSDAGGTGRSYHADLTAKNQQQRVHYLLQPGWEASKAVQGFGRTHRSNQASAPIFRLITTNVMGQKRFTSTIARRLDQLGALTKGQRQAGSGVFGEKDNLENPIAMDALSRYYRSVNPELLKRLGLYEKIYDSTGKFNENSDALRNIGMFLNRILSLEVDEQNEVFQGFYDTFDAFMDAAIANGTVDMGLENYRADKIEVVDEKVVRKDSSGADTKYVQMTVYRKPNITPFSKVKDEHPNFRGLVRLEDGSVRAVYEISSKTNERTGAVQKRFKLETPVKGKYSTFVEETLKAQTKDIPKAEWKEAWNAEISKAPEYDTSTLHLLTGTLLPIWDRLPQDNTRVMRVLSSDGRQYLGRVIRADQIDGILRGMGATRTMKHYTGREVSEGVLGGKEAIFRDGRMKLKRSRVSGEWRLELTGNNVFYISRQYNGIITERINYDTRFFIPIGEKGEKIIEEIAKTNPILEIRDAAASETLQMRDSVNPDSNAHPELWTTERIKSGGVTAPKPLSDIIAQISHDLGVHVTYGHVRGKGVLGQFSTKDKGVRSKIAQDLPTISHEIGHWLDDRYGLISGRLSKELKAELEKALGERKDDYNPSVYAKEGFAEFIRQFLQNRETAAIEYPTLTECILNALSAKELALFEQFADEINAYYALDADTATSSVKLREEAMPDFRTHEERLSDLGDAFKQAWTDSNNAIRRLDEETGGNAYVFATNAAYSDARAARILDSDLCDINGKYVGPGLRTALHGINTRDKTEWREFGEYLIVRHGPERLENGKRVFADDRKNNAAFMEKRRIELEDKYPEFKAAGDRVIQYEKALTQTWGVNTGLISQELFDSWQELYQNHVPLNRAVSTDKRRIGAKRGFANQFNPIRRAKGSGLDIIHPVENIISETVILVNAGVRNDVMRRIAEQASKYEADAAIMEKVPTPLVRRSFDMTDVKASMKDRAAENVMQGTISLESANAIDDIVSGIDDVLYQYERGKAKDNVVTVLRNGTPEFWKINDRQLLESVTHLTTPKMSGILEAYAVSTRFMTANITGNNPIWSIFSNAPRDLGTFMVYFKGNRAKALKAIASAYVNAFNEAYREGNDVDPLYSEYLAMGGGHSSAYSADINLAKRARKSYTKTAAQTVLDTINPVNWVSFISDTIEMGPRFATYKIMRESGMDPHEAFYEAMDVTVNFRRGGVASRQVGKVVPFFNASVQGIDKFGRFFSAEDVKSADRAKAAGKRITMFLAASAALAALSYGVNNGDDEKEKEYQQLSNYTKNTYWCIPIGDGKYFCIPKPRELAVMTSLFETLLERTIGGNEHAFDEFVSYAADNFLPSIVSDFATYPENTSKEGSSEAMKDLIAGTTGSLGLFGVFANMIANRDFLGKPIESQRERNTEPRDRYTQTTSKIAYWIGQAFNWSPEMIDYFGNQVLGYLWKAPKALFPVGDENVDFTLGVKNTYLKDNAYSQDLVNWLYDRAEKSKLAHGSDKGNMDKAIANKNDSSMTTFYSRFNSLNKTVKDPNGRRQARQTVLDMINEYRKAADSGVTTAAQKLVYDVVRDMGETELMPSVLNTYIKAGETTYNLTDSQYVEYQTLYLNTYWSYAEQHLAGNHSKKEKIALLRQAKAVAKESASRTILRRMGVAYSGFYDKFDGVSDKDIITFKAELDLADDDGSLKQDEVIDIVTMMVRDGLSYDDAYTLFHSKYDSDKNNPWA